MNFNQQFCLNKPILTIVSCYIPSGMVLLDSKKYSYCHHFSYTLLKQKAHTEWSCAGSSKSTFGKRTIPLETSIGLSSTLIFLFLSILGSACHAERYRGVELQA